MCVALWVCAANTRPVYASCGDYLDHARNTADDPSWNPFQSEPDSQTPFRGPCHGPECQRAPEAPGPLSSTTPRLIKPFDGWRPEAEIVLIPGAARAFFADTALEVSDGYPLRVEHPPRG